MEIFRTEKAVERRLCYTIDTRQGLAIRAIYKILILRNFIY